MPIEIVNDAILVAGLSGSDQDRETFLQHPKWQHLPLKRIGVRLSDGSVPQISASAYRNRRPKASAIAPLPTGVNNLSGTSIYGGIAGPQFGHLITQSLGRLWLAQHFPHARIVFLGANMGFRELPSFFHDLLRQMGVHNRIELITAPSKCDELVLGPDLCNLSHRPCAAPNFVEWWRTERPTLVGKPTLDLYVSRSGLSLGHGQYLQETLLEEALFKVGYTIIKPERLTIAEQADLYGRAKRLVFADGSAAHLWSLFAHPDAKAAVVMRRPKDRHFTAWFKGLDCAGPTFLDFCLVSMTRSGGGGGRSLGLIDLNAAWSALAKAGYHDETGEIGPPRAQLEAWVASLPLRKGRIPHPAFHLDERSAALISLRNRVKIWTCPGKVESTN
jgi:hypothetical protein